jgi:hypothetical protein
MNKRKRILKIGIAGIVVLAIIVSIFVWYSSNREEWLFYERRESIESIIHVEVANGYREGIAFIVTEEERYDISLRSYLPSHQIVLASDKGSVMRLGESLFPSVIRHDRAEVNIYNLVTRELVETIDIIPLFEPFSEEFQLQSSVALTFMDEAGDMYLGWLSRDIPTTAEFTQEQYRFILNLRTREVSFYEELPERFALEEQRELNLQLSIFNSWSLEVEGVQSRSSRFRRVNGMDGISLLATGIPSLVEIGLEAINLPQESQELYSMFPGLREFIGQEGLVITIYIGGKPSAEEILTMFMEDGQEINFEGSIMRDDWSIDGQEHEIHSFEDFFRWVNTERALESRPTHF